MLSSSVCEPPCARLTSLQYIICFESQSRTADPKLYFHLQTYLGVRLGLRLSVMDPPTWCIAFDLLNSRIHVVLSYS